MATEGKLTVKLLIDKKSHKVLFAEAGKDFVDFLFNIPSLPIGTVISLLKEHGMVGSLGNLYDSIENLNETYFVPNQDRNAILHPRSSISVDSDVPFLLNVESSSSTKRYYRCGSGYHHNYISDDPNAICGSCRSRLSSPLEFVNPTANKQAAASGEGGYVKGVVTYMVMDDLVVKPMSTISCITLLTKFNVSDVGVLEEKVVDVDMNLGLKFLKSSLKSKTVLTDVFLGNNVKK